MEELKYSILVSPYANGYQFRNFLWTACRQYFEGYEIVVYDNATPTDEIFLACREADCSLSKIRYFSIRPENKTCTNITQGINRAAKMAQGKYVVIVADSNVLLSFNLLSQIDKIIDDRSIVLSSGNWSDVKISPTGDYSGEYAKLPANEMQQTCSELLSQMGWPDDPSHLKLIEGKHRFPPPHDNSDVYVVAMEKKWFESFGGYDENSTCWGDYHNNFVQHCSKVLIRRELEGVKVIHQYHRVFKGDTAA